MAGTWQRRRKELGSGRCLEEGRELTAGRWSDDAADHPLTPLRCCEHLRSRLSSEQRHAPPHCHRTRQAAPSGTASGRDQPAQLRRQKNRPQPTAEAKAAAVGPPAGRQPQLDRRNSCRRVRDQTQTRRTPNSPNGSPRTGQTHSTANCAASSDTPVARASPRCWCQSSPTPHNPTWPDARLRTDPYRTRTPVPHGYSLRRQRERRSLSASDQMPPVASQPHTIDVKFT